MSGTWSEADSTIDVDGALVAESDFYSPLILVLIRVCVNGGNRDI